MPFTLAALSDQHIDRDTEPGSWELARRAFRAAADARVDHLVIAGDTFDGSSAFLRDAGTVKSCLRRLGFWRRDRLSIVPGNHDIFHLSERKKFGEGWKMIFGDAQETYEAFWDWISDLVDPADMLHEDDIYPVVKCLGRLELVCADTTARTTRTSTIGYWRKRDDRALRRALVKEPAAGTTRILCCHHPPYPGPEESLLEQLWKTLRDREIHFGFEPGDYRRLARFADDMHIRAVLCGHLHETGGDPYDWRIGRATKVHLLGRTGGMHDTLPCFGLLTLGPRGGLRLNTIPIYKNITGS